MLRLLFLLLLTGFAGACTYLGEPIAPEDFVNRYEEKPDYLSLRHASGAEPTVGIFFYPGALVDPHAYLGWLDTLVSRNPELVAVVVKVPANLAVFAAEKAFRLRDRFPTVQRWVLSGHSLGGAMACRAANRNRSATTGLVLLAAYPADADDLSDWPRPALSLSAQFDGLTTPDDLARREGQLPAPFRLAGPDAFPADLGAQTYYYEIPGGNHAQFGNYGTQSGDGTATITAAEQQQAVVEAITQYLNRL